MADVLDTDEVQDLRNWQCRDGNDLTDDQLQSLCDSHNALLDEVERWREEVTIARHLSVVRQQGEDQACEERDAALSEVERLRNTVGAIGDLAGSLAALSHESHPSKFVLLAEGPIAAIRTIVLDALNGTAGAKEKP